MRKFLHIPLMLVFLIISCNDKGNSSSGREVVDKKEIVLKDTPIDQNEFDLNVLNSFEDSLIQDLDLSNRKLGKIPDLSKIRVHKLNLSNNFIDTIPISYLPKELSILNLSHNNFQKKFRLPKNSLNIDELDLSYNKIESADISVNLRKLDLSQNNLIYVTLSNKRMKFLNISDNPRLSNVVQFQPKGIDTIIHHNISNDEPIIGAVEDIYNIIYDD